MKKLLLALLFVSQSVFAWEQQAPLQINQCVKHSPYGLPVVSKPDATLICRNG